MNNKYFIITLNHSLYFGLKISYIVSYYQSQNKINQMSQKKKYSAKFNKTTNPKQNYVQKEVNSHKKYQEKNVAEKKQPKYVQKYEKQQYSQDNNQKETTIIKEQEFQQRQKIKTSRIPDHIIDASILVDQQELGLAVETRYIKKYFLQKFMEAVKDQLKIRKAKYTPCIFFQFCNKNRRYQYVQYKDLVKCNKKRFTDNPELTSFIYQQLYDRVEPKYFRLAVFGIKIAKEKHIPITNLSVFRQENIETQLMFYYCLNKKKETNFLLIDKYLNFVYFYTEDILRWSQIFPDQYDLYVKFHKAASNKEKKQHGDAWDILENEEIIFNENEIKYFCESLQNLERKLQKHTLKAQKQMVEIQQELKQKKQKLQKISKQQSNQIWALEKMQLEIMKMQQKIHYLKRTIKEIQVQKKRLSYKHTIDQWFYIKAAKRIILAEKEMTSKLPILQRKKEILDLLRYSSNTPIIIEGETGSGKSTQLPQILLQFCSILDSSQSKPILVTQPRRLATRTLAERVCHQLGQERPNNFVDFQNNMQKQINPNAKIVFKLDRLVLDEIAQDPLLQKYSCLVIDEAHQRTISIDVLIGLVRKILDERRDFRVLITSASMDVQLFQRQFQTKALKVSGRLYDVAIQYKDYEVQSTLQKIQKVLDQQILRDENSLKQNFQGHVLVFCSSLDQINKLTQIYTKKLNNNRFSIFPLHGKIVPQQQRKVFQPCKQHKIIFASRIAQTAITIDDVRVVVDPGQDIELVYDQKYKFSSMKLRNISQSSAKQRAGRAGRTAPGRCFRLYSQQSYNQRPLGKVPEMENSSLDTVVLRLKSLGIQDVIKFPYISKPDKEGLLASIQNLKMIGGLDQNEQITQVGELLITIPVQPMLARSIIQALLFDEVNRNQKSIQIPKDNGSFVQNIVQILCMLVNSSSLFYIFQENQNEGQLRKFQQFEVSDGDFWFLRSIYRQFKQNLKLVGDKAELNFWFKEFYLSKKTLKQVKQLESQILRLVASIIQMKRLKIQKMQIQIDEIKEKLRHCKSWKDVLLSCLTTSFIPNLCVYSQDPRIGYTLISQKRPIAIYGTSTLSLVGLNQNSPKWILSYDFYTSQKGKFYCKIAQGIDFNFLKNNINTYVWNKFNLAKAEQFNPFYSKVWQNTLPTKLYASLKSQYIRFMGGVGSQAQKRQLYEKSVWIFDDDDNLLKIFVFKDSNTQKEQDLKLNYMTYFLQIKNRFLKKEFRYAYFGNSQVIFTSDFAVKTIQRVIQKDLLISDYLEQDYNLIKRFMKDNFSQHADVEIFPFGRNIKMILHEQTNIKYVQRQVQQFFNEAELKQRPKVKQIPRNERNLSKSKIILVFYVQNIHHKFQNKSQKYYNMLKAFIDLQGSRLQLTEKTDIEWRQQICILLKRVNVNPENCAINVWGNYESFHKMSEFVQVYAEISSFQNGIYEKLKQFEGKKQYLGCDKLFIKRTYEQIISFPTETIFKALKEQFLEIVIGEKRKCKDLQFTQKSTKMRGIHYVKIIGKSINRQALIKAAENIQMLFDPKIIELTDQQTKFLLQIDRNTILFKIEHKYMFGIAFEWNKFSRNLSVYCRSVYFDQIVSQLRKYIKESNFITNKLSYIGKNLNQVVKILNRHKQNLTKNKIKLSYEILFNKKQIRITTLPQYFYQLKTQIQALSNPSSEECKLCMDKNQSAYILINCSHVFCKVCILGLVRVEVSAHEQPINCPKNGCTENINIFDIQMILGENLFQKEADERIKKYVIRQDEMSMCPKCLVIIRKEQSQTKNCQICGYKRVQKTNH